MPEHFHDLPSVLRVDIRGAGALPRTRHGISGEARPRLRDDSVGCLHRHEQGIAIMKTIHVEKGFDLRFADGLAYLTIPSAQLSMNAEVGGRRHVYRIRQADKDEVSTSHSLEIDIADQIRVLVPVTDLQVALLPHMNGLVVRIVSGANRDVARFLAVMDGSRNTDRPSCRLGMADYKSVAMLSSVRRLPVIPRPDTGAGVVERPQAG